MSELKTYLHSQFETRIESIKSSQNVHPDLSRAYGKINDALERPECKQIIEIIENQADNMAFDGYVYGFKDGMRFLLNMATAQ